MNRQSEFRIPQFSISRRDMLRRSLGGFGYLALNELFLKR